MTETIESSIAFHEADTEVQKEARDVDRAMQRLDHTLGALEDMFTMTSPALVFQYGPLPLAVIASLDRARNDARSVASVIIGQLQNAGRPSCLSEVASVWREDVTKPVSEHMGLFNEDGMDIDRWWKGKAPEEYVGHLPKQEAALGAIKDRAKDLADALDFFAAAIIGFWKDLRKRILDYVNEFVETLGSVDPLRAWQTLAKLVNGMVGMVTGLWKDLEDKHAEFKTKVDDLQSLLVDMEGFPRGHWPGPHGTFYERSWIPDPEEG